MKDNVQNKIGILVLSIGNFGNKGFYNLQEVGLAKALSAYYREVLVYRLINQEKQENAEKIEGYNNVTVHFIPSGQLGSNGIPDMQKIDTSITALICFSDTQIMLKRVEKWCNEYNITLIPYIGVIRSHSDNLVKQKLMDVLFIRNLAIYKKHKCIAKTPAVVKDLQSSGVRDVVVAPVGLDTDLLVKDYEKTDVNELKKKYGYSSDDKVILFIGRMTAEKQPERMIEIYSKVFEYDKSFKLMMIGNGELESVVQNRINAYGLSSTIQRINKIPNKDMWELYRLADCLVNLNQQEIFGMVLMEALYYECRVIAWDAPGPNYIIRDGKDGWIISNNKTAVEKILNREKFNTHDYIENEFTWEKTAEIVYDLLQR